MLLQFSLLCLGGVAGLYLSTLIARKAWPPSDARPPRSATWALLSLAIWFATLAAVLGYLIVVGVWPMPEGLREGYGASVGITFGALAPFGLLIALIATLRLSRVRFVQVLWVVAIAPLLAGVLLDSLLHQASSATNANGFPWDTILAFMYVFTLFGMAYQTLRLAAATW